MIYVIDRIEENLTAVCEDENGRQCFLPVSSLPEGAKEGSVLTETGTGFALNTDEEEARRQANFDLAESLFGDEN